MYKYLVLLCLFLYRLFCGSLTSDSFVLEEDREETKGPTDLPVFRLAFLSKIFTYTAARVLVVLLMLAN